MPSLTTSQKIAVAASVPIAAVLIYVLLKWAREDELEEIETEVDEDHGQEFATNSEVVLEVKVPQMHVGAVIGRAGSTIKQIQKESQARINFKDDEESSDNEGEKGNHRSRTILIRGSLERTKQAEVLIRKVIAEQPVIKKARMDIPPRVIGRVIGKGGKTIRQLCRISGAKIRIDCDDGRNDCQSCEIVGTQAQIESAKQLIQEKIDDDKTFRTKEKNARSDRGRNTSRFVQPPSDGAYFGVYVSAMDTPGHFWIQRVTKDSKQLDNLVEEMTVFYGDRGEGHVLRQPTVGDLCSSPFLHDQSWYRGEIIEVVSSAEVRVHYLDFGDTESVSTSSIKEMRKEYSELPFQAIECYLAKIRPKDGVWSKVACDLFEKLSHCSQWKVLMARVIRFDNGLPCIELFDTNGELDVNIEEELVKHGYAVYTEKSQNFETVDASENASTNEALPMPRTDEKPVTNESDIPLENMDQQFQSLGFDDEGWEMDDLPSFDIVSPLSSTGKESSSPDNLGVTPSSCREPAHEPVLSADEQTVVACADLSKLPTFLDWNGCEKNPEAFEAAGEKSSGLPKEETKRLLNESERICGESVENVSEKMLNRHTSIPHEFEKEQVECEENGVCKEGVGGGILGQTRDRRVTDVLEELPQGRSALDQEHIGGEFPAGSLSPGISMSWIIMESYDGDVIVENTHEEHLESDNKDLKVEGFPPYPDSALTTPSKQGPTLDSSQDEHLSAYVLRRSHSDEIAPDGTPTTVGTLRHEQHHVSEYDLRRTYSDYIKADETLINGGDTTLARSCSEVVVSSSKQADEMDGKADIASKSVGSITRLTKGNKRWLAANFNQSSKNYNQENEKEDEDDEDDDSLYLSAREDSDSTGFVSAAGSRTNLRATDTDSDVTPSGYLSDPDEDFNDSYDRSELRNETRLDNTLLAEKLEQYADK